ncbi:MAG: fumarylacetoacetate hydrolase family protein [Casimicrobiaceae bacterium]
MSDAAWSDPVADRAHRPDPHLVHALVEARHALDRAARGSPHFDGLRADEVPAPRDATEAYAVQDAVARELGWFATVRPSAWKVGAATRDSTPEATPLPPAGVARSPAAFAARRIVSIGIEGELAFRLRTAPEPERFEQAIDDAIDDTIGELIVTLEIVAPRFRELAAMPPLLRLADQGVHGALVVGTGVSWQGPIDWEQQVAIVRRNGVVASETRGGHPLGDLRFLLPWLARHAASRGQPLAAGDIVTAGTWTGLLSAKPGETLVVEFPGIGAASVSLA